MVKVKINIGYIRLLTTAVGGSRQLKIKPTKRNLRKVILWIDQDTVVLGKKMYDFLHSFGKSRDPFLPPTLNSKQTTIDAQEKGDEFGNEARRKKGAPAKTNDLDSLNERARKNEKDSLLRP